MTETTDIEAHGESEWRRQFERISPKPLYKQVAEKVRDSIVRGEIASGAALPTERQLGEVFGVSRSSVREAMRVLEAEGWVVEDGNVRKVVALDEFGPLKVALLDYMQLQQASLHDLIEFRGILESSAVALASQHPVSSYLAQAEEILRQMENPEVDPSEFDRLNMEFHLAVVASSGNEVIVRVMRLLREALSGYLPDLLAQAGNPRGMLNRMVEEHREILTAIAAGDATRAASLARSHVEGAYQAEATDEGKPLDITQEPKGVTT